MRKVILYMVLGLLVALILQPNLAVHPLAGKQAIPVNRTSQAPTTNATLELQSDLKKSKICIDPEGQDEASNEVIFSLAKKFGKALKKQGYKVIYTQKKNENLSNSERLNVAIEKKADVLISLRLENQNDPHEERRKKERR